MGALTYLDPVKPSAQALPKLLRAKAVRIDRAILEELSWLISHTSVLGLGSLAFCFSSFHVCCTRTLEALALLLECSSQGLNK